MKALLAVTLWSNIHRPTMSVIDNMLVKCVMYDWNDTVPTHNDKRKACIKETKVAEISVSDAIVIDGEIYSIIHMLSASDDSDTFKRFRKTYGTKVQINCWIPAKADEPTIFNSVEEAETELASLKLMQPENIYKIEAV